MRRQLVGGAELLVLATGLAGFLVLRGGIPGDLIGRAYILFVCALGLFLLVQVLRHSGDASDRQVSPARSAAQAAVPQELSAIDDRLRAGRVSRPDFDHVVRPLLAEVAADRLLALGVELRRQPERARALLGEPLSQVVLSRGASSATLQDKGPTRRELESLLDLLDGIGR